MSTEQPHPLTLAREERNLTQDDLAQAVGVSSRTIWAAEHGKPVGAYTRRRLCKYFKKTAQELGLVSEESQVRTKKKKKKRSMSYNIYQNRPMSRRGTLPSH